VSTSHGNTKKVADAMARVLGAQVLEPEQVDPESLREYALVGFGSGIFFAAYHERLRAFIKRLPHLAGTRAFLFATSGGPEVPLLSYNRPLTRGLAEHGFEVISAFRCPGYDTWLPLRFIGGINRGRPDARDLTNAETFARDLRDRFL